MSNEVNLVGGLRRFISKRENVFFPFIFGKYSSLLNPALFCRVQRRSLQVRN